MIGRLHHVIVDCPDPESHADFWSAVLGKPVTYRTPDFCVVSADDRTSGLAFQRAEGHVAPTWPDPTVPQQVHLDVMVDDLTAGGAEVLRLGAHRLDDSGVYADPAGHPFCLIPLPSWVDPVR